VKDRGPQGAPTFANGMACTGVLYKDTGIDPNRLLIGTERALGGDPANWQNHALHGGALYRNGKFPEAMVALQKAIALHGKAHPLTHNLLALTHLALGETEKAKAALAAARAAEDAPWEDSLLHWLFEPELNAAFDNAALKK
jgi:tetratricopeptide (TPR) repeat protein